MNKQEMTDHIAKMLAQYQGEVKLYAPQPLPGPKRYRKRKEKKDE